MSDSALPAIRRVVTGHDSSGRAIVKADTAIPTRIIPSGDAAFALLWTTATIPADNNDETDGAARDAGLTLQSGSVIRIVDMLPGGSSPMHRSNSVDYGIVLSGEIELELDDGAKTLLGPGDIVIQRGSIHLWRNPSPSTTCRIAFILIEAKAAVVNGAALPEIQP